MSLWQRLLNAIGRRDLEPDIDEEIRFHIDSRIADNQAAGMSAAEMRSPRETSSSSASVSVIDCPAIARGRSPA